MYINWNGLVILCLSLFAIIAIARECDYSKQIKALEKQTLNCSPPSKLMCVELTGDK